MTADPYEITPHLTDDDLHTWRHSGSGELLVVCFSPTGEADPHVPQDPSFPSAATNNGARHVLFISDPQRSWLNTSGLREKIRLQVEEFKAQVGATRVVTLGHSMGGFYALACAADLNAEAALALAPQITIHPDIAGDDRRWMGFRERIDTFLCDSAASLMTSGPTYFVIHGEKPRERPQRDRTPIGENIVHFILPDVHHNVPAILKRHNIQQDFINTCLAGDVAGAQSLLEPLGAYRRTAQTHPMLGPVKAAQPARQPAPQFSTDSITYFFVMDGPRFETPGLLLSESLRSTLHRSAKIIAYVPQAVLGQIHPVIRRMMDLQEVEVRSFDTNQAKWSSPYPHGNKILAALEPRDTDLSVFLDTDVVCLTPPDFSDITPNTALFATPEGVATWGREDSDWEAVYDMFDLPVPDWRVRLTKGYGRTILPYFNAGVVGFVESGLPGTGRLPEMWHDTALAIDAAPHIANKRPWLDQISLPVAAARLGGEIKVLPGLYNFSAYRLPENPDISQVKFFHYHMPAHYRKHALSRRVSEYLLARAPERLRWRVRRRLGVFARGIKLPEELL